MKKLLLLSLVALALHTYAQNVGINNTSPKTSLDVKGGIRNQAYYLIGSGTSIVIPNNHSNINLSGSFTGQFLATIAQPEDGQKLTIDNLSNETGVLNSTVDIRKGLNEYTFSDGEWKAVNTNAWNLTGNDGVSSASQFIGTLNKDHLVFKTYGTEQMRLHQQGGLSIGTPIHTEALDLAGNANISGEIMPQGQAGQAGQVLQSNGNGTMNWANINKYPNSRSFSGFFSNMPNSYQIFTFTVPNNITEIWAECWEGGDGGGFLPATITNTTYAKGGDGGSYVSGLVKVIPGETLTLLVGNGGTSGVNGGFTWIERGATPIFGINTFGFAIDIIDPISGTNGIQKFVGGAKGSAVTYSYQQAGTSLFYRTFTGGRGGDAYPASKGGDGITVSYDNTTNNFVSYLNSGFSGSTGSSGATPSGGGGVGFGSGAGFGGSGGVGYMILHW